MSESMFSIGEFSQVTGLTIKTLRFYHEEGLLIPSRVDQQSGYRYYDDSQIELARTIAYLRDLEFPLNEIKTLLDSRNSDEQILEVMQRQRVALGIRVAQYKSVLRQLDEFISEERRVSVMAESEFHIQEKSLDAVMMAGIRMKGRYSDCGKAFGKLGRQLGRQIGGKPFLLHYDAEYKENDADFEACMPIRQRKQVDGASVRQLPAVRCVSLLHKGPYEQLGKSYAKVLKYVKERGYTIVMPTREIYIKGPGMIFKGNPRNYLTEIQISIESAGGRA
jgi:DNA-binding transcriptional MerR regulator